MTKVGDRFHPGDLVPTSGLYECNTQCGHRFEWSTNVADKRFPPFRAGCRGAAWVLRVPRP